MTKFFGRGSVLAASLRCLVMGLAAAFLASAALAQGAFQGEGFRLSSSAGGTDARTFTRGDTLYMLVWSDRVDTSRIRRSTWRLRAGDTSRSGSLVDNGDGSFGASFDLSGLPSRTDWTWSARLEDRSRRRYTPSVSITVTDEPPVVEAPTAAFSASPLAGDAPLTVSFQDTSSGSPTSWSWDFGDGGGSSQRSPQHVYSSAGSYTVTLTASNAGGSSQSVQADLIQVQVVVGAPTAAFSASPLSGDAPLTVSFQDTSSGSPTSWSWDFGDGSGSSQRSPQHVYSSAGAYTVTLTASNAGGSSQSVQADLIQVQAVVGAPTASFGAGPLEGDAPLTVSFQDTSSGSPTSWSWDFGDGSGSSQRSPQHVYSSAGLFTVTLTASNAGGSSQSLQSDLIRVRDVQVAPAIEYGMNSSENTWSQRAIAFADAMARASEFVRVVNGQFTSELAPVIPLGRQPARLGEGWPDPAALSSSVLTGTRLFGSMAGSVPDGRTTPYVVTWEGTGSCRLVGPLVLGEANRTANRVEYAVDPNRGGGDGVLAWILDASSAADPVRNVHVWLPGMESQKPLFWPPFLQKLQAMNGGRGPHTWRTLDWCQINRYGRTDGAAPFVFDLAGRITAASPSQGTRRGVCPEFQVALCNAIGANLHFLVPHQADDISDTDYERFIREALLVIRDGAPAVPGVNGGQPFAGLASGRTVTLSYSNEIWNAGFVVNGWMRDRAIASGRTLQQQIAVETERVFAIAREVFSGTDAPRLRTYIGGWIANPGFLGGILAALSPGVQVDAVGPAGYFRPLSSTINGWLSGASSSSCPNCPTPEEVVQASLQSIPVLDARFGDHLQVARSYVNPDGSSPALELYEAGASYIAGFQPWAGAAATAQSIPAMYHAYVDDVIPTMVANGVTLVNWYSFVSSYDVQGGSGAGPFGHWDNMNQTITLPVPDVYVDEGAPKAAAIYRGPPSR